MRFSPTSFVAAVAPALALFAGGCGEDGTNPDAAIPTPDASSPAPDASDLPDLAPVEDLSQPAPDLIPPVYHRATPLAEAAAAWHPGADKLILFGGDSAAAPSGNPAPDYRNDTWIYDRKANAWFPSSKGPSARGRAVAVFDSSTLNHTLLIGGRTRPPDANANVPYTLLADTWHFEDTLELWAQRATTGDPAGRSGAVATHDGARKRTLLFSGSFDTAFDADPAHPTVTNELWQLDAQGAWTKLSPKGGPPPARHLAAAALDPKRQRWVVMGGCCDEKGAMLRDAWALDLATDTWSLLSDGVGGPPRRMGATAGYDAKNDWITLFGGYDDSPMGVRNDVWGLAEDNNWYERNPGDLFENPLLGCGGVPGGKQFDFVLAIFGSPERRERGFLVSTDDGMILGGGVGDCGMLDDTWELRGGTFTELIPATRGVSCLRRGDRCPCLCN